MLKTVQEVGAQKLAAVGLYKCVDGIVIFPENQDHDNQREAHRQPSTSIMCLLLQETADERINPTRLSFRKNKSPAEIVAGLFCS